MTKIIIELEVEDAQELASTARTTAKKIDWVLENTPPKKDKADALDIRIKKLSVAATAIETALHQRTLANENVVKIGAKK